MRDPEPDHSLRPDDAAALDRLVDSGFDPPGDSEQTRRLVGLLGLLDTPVASSEDRSARIDLAVLMARRSEVATVENGSARLTDPDRAALDHWVERGTEGAPDSIAARVSQHESLARLGVSGSHSSDRNERIARTMAAVEADQRLRSERMRFEQGPELRGWRMRLADVVSLAAMLLIAASVALPAINGARNKNQMLACDANMQGAARAMGMYAGDHSDYLPMATAGFGGSWMDVGTPDRSNSANLYTLVRTGYQSLEGLACPGNPNAARGKGDPEAWDWRSMEEISYSYRIMPSDGMRVSIRVPTAAQVVVASDRSPVTLRAANGLVIFPEANSPNHRGRGQHLLRLDGSSAWEGSPVVDGDNIWLPRPIEQVIERARRELGLIQGTEMPESPTDAFVGP
ncbi:MAG: hypothetical protein AAGA55_07030 [Planctomycetota bacterium]